MPEVGQPPADTPPAPAPAVDAVTGEPVSPDQPNAAETARLVAELRKEAAKARSELKRYQDAEKAAKEATLSETEKLQTKNTELERLLAAGVAAQQEQVLRMATVSAAAKLGYADVEDAVRLLDVAKIAYAEDGRPRNVEALLGELLHAKPYLRATHTMTPDLGQGVRGGTGTLTMEQVRRMSPEEVAADVAAVNEAVARSGRT